MLRTPLPFRIPSFLLGVARAFDMGGTFRPEEYEAYLSGNACAADRRAILGDFLVVVHDLDETFESGR